MNDKRAGFVCLVGPSNSGKSTLLNHIVGVKIAGVTHKVQTTRARLRGIAHQGDTQMIFIDTPGIFHSRSRFEKAMVAEAWIGIDDADIVLFMVEAHQSLTQGVHHIAKKLAERKVSKKTLYALVLNKIDRASSEKLLKLSAALNGICDFDKTFMISVKRGHGVDDIKEWVAQSLPHCEWLYHQDQIADQSMDKIAADITREKIMLRLHQELPYQITVEPESWEAKKDGSVRVEQIIYVARAGHRGIVLGQGGAVLKAISKSARVDISKIAGRRVHLFLRVKHVADWQNKKEYYQAIGLDF